MRIILGMTPSKDLSEICTSLGSRFREARKRRFPGDDQQTFARRLGVSRETLRKMERGDPSVAFGRYLQAARLLDCLEGFETLFELEQDLFEKAGL